MRLKDVALLLVAIFVGVATPSNSRADGKGPFEKARQRCARWFVAGEKGPAAFEGKKITAVSIANDFKIIEKEVGGEKGLASLTASKFTENKDNIPRDDDEAAALLVAIWHAWRAVEPKGGLKSVLADLGDFAKVRFKSQPKAAVTVDDMAHGDTTVDVYLRKDGKYVLKMSAAGYEAWVKEQYTPPAKGEIINETLKKKK